MTDKPSVNITEAAAWIELELGNVKERVKLKPSVAAKLDNGVVPPSFRVDSNGMPSGGQTTDRSLYLFDKEQYKHIKSFQSTTRREHNKRTVPDGRRGKDIITAKAMAGVGMGGVSYEDWLNGRRIELEPLARDFAYQVYPRLMNEAKIALAPVWDDIKHLYESPDQVFERIYMRWDFTTIPPSKQWAKLKDLDPEERKKMTEQAEYKERLIAHDFSQRVCARIRERVSNFAETMTAKGSGGKDGFKRFSQTMVDALNDLTESLEALNYNDDELIEEIREDLMSLTADGTLTKDAITDGGETFREDLKDEADAILDKVKLFEAQLA